MRHLQWECAMHLRPLSRPSATLALWMIGSSLVSRPATTSEVAPTDALIAEARRAFTLNGKQIPSEIFRDFGYVGLMNGRG
jgi:hypothetical protein